MTAKYFTTRFGGVYHIGTEHLPHGGVMMKCGLAFYQWRGGDYRGRPCKNCFKRKKPQA